MAARPALRFAARFAGCERGATVVEYAVLIVFLGMAIVASLSLLEDKMYVLINGAVSAALAAIS